MKIESTIKREQFMAECRSLRELMRSHAMQFRLAILPSREQRLSHRADDGAFYLRHAITYRNLAGAYHQMAAAA